MNRHCFRRRKKRKIKRYNGYSLCHSHIQTHNLHTMDYYGDSVWDSISNVTFLGGGGYACAFKGTFRGKQSIIKVFRTDEEDNLIRARREVLGCEIVNLIDDPTWVKTYGWSETTKDAPDVLKDAVNTSSSGSYQSECKTSLDKQNVSRLVLVQDVAGEQDLHTLIKSSAAKLPAETVRKIAFQLIWGVFMAQTKLGIIHTDIKPQNIVLKEVTSSERRTYAIRSSTAGKSDVFTIDFQRGDYFATFVDVGNVYMQSTQKKPEDNDLDSVMSDTTVRTPVYASPEYHTSGDTQKTSFQADYWALGLSLFAVAVGAQMYKALDDFSAKGGKKQQDKEYLKICQEIAASIGNGNVDMSASPYKNASTLIESHLGSYGHMLLQDLLKLDPVERAEFGLQGSDYGVNNALFHPYFILGGPGSFYNGVIDAKNVASVTTGAEQGNEKPLSLQEQTKKNAVVQKVTVATQKILAIIENNKSAPVAKGVFDEAEIMNATGITALKALAKKITGTDKMLKTYTKETFDAAKTALVKYLKDNGYTSSKHSSDLKQCVQELYQFYLKPGTSKWLGTSAYNSTAQKKFVECFEKIKGTGHKWSGIGTVSPFFQDDKEQTYTKKESAAGESTTVADPLTQKHALALIGLAYAVLKKTFNSTVGDRLRAIMDSTEADLKNDANAVNSLSIFLGAFDMKAEADTELQRIEKFRREELNEYVRRVTALAQTVAKFDASIAKIDPPNIPNVEGVNDALNALNFIEPDRIDPLINPVDKREYDNALQSYQETLERLRQVRIRVSELKAQLEQRKQELSDKGTDNTRLFIERAKALIEQLEGYKALLRQSQPEKLQTKEQIDQAIGDLAKIPTKLPTLSVPDVYVETAEYRELRNRYLTQMSGELQRIISDAKNLRDTLEAKKVELEQGPPVKQPAAPKPVPQEFLDAFKNLLEAHTQGSKKLDDIKTAYDMIFQNGQKLPDFGPSWVRSEHNASGKIAQQELMLVDKDGSKVDGIFPTDKKTKFAITSQNGFAITRIIVADLIVAVLANTYNVPLDKLTESRTVKELGKFVKNIGSTHLSAQAWEKFAQTTQIDRDFKKQQAYLGIGSATPAPSNTPPEEEEDSSARPVSPAPQAQPQVPPALSAADEKEIMEQPNITKLREYAATKGVPSNVLKDYRKDTLQQAKRALVDYLKAKKTTVVLPDTQERANLLLSYAKELTEALFGDAATEDFIKQNDPVITQVVDVMHNAAVVIRSMSKKNKTMLQDIWPSTTAGWGNDGNVEEALQIGEEDDSPVIASKNATSVNKSSAYKLDMNDNGDISGTDFRDAIATHALFVFAAHHVETGNVTLSEEKFKEYLLLIDSEDFKSGLAVIISATGITVNSIVPIIIAALQRGKGSEFITVLKEKAQQVSDAEIYAALTHLGLTHSSVYGQEDVTEDSQYLHALSAAAEILHAIDLDEAVDAHLVDRCYAEWPHDTFLIKEGRVYDI